MTVLSELGRILSVETITLPILDGYVNTESNFFADSTLNELNQTTYSPVISCAVGQQAGIYNQTNDINSSQLQGQLIDILRVYYEFGPMVCGLVNLIDFIPRFYSPTVTTSNTNNDANPPLELASSPPEATSSVTGNIAEPLNECNCEQKMNQKIPATESLTRLIRRSLSWFECERKRILQETSATYHSDSSSFKQPNMFTRDNNEQPASQNQSQNNNGVDLKLCNLQVHQKTLLKAQLIQANRAPNVQQLINTRTMAHEKCKLVELLAKQWTDMLPTCPLQCMNNPTSGGDSQKMNNIADDCQEPMNNNNNNISISVKTIEQQIQDRFVRSPHLIQLAQPYELKFVRLAYIVPVYNKYAIRSIWPLHCQLKSFVEVDGHAASRTINKDTPIESSSLLKPATLEDDSHNEQLLIDQESVSLELQGEEEEEEEEEEDEEGDEDDEEEEDEEDEDTSSGESEDSSLDGTDDKMMKEILLAETKEEELVKQAALKIVARTRERHRADEEAHQANESETSPTSSTGDESSLIGQLTYRLFAPCQLVNSSSCFAINPPINSNSPLARRGSVDLNGSGVNPESVQPTTLVLGASQSSTNQDNSCSSFTVGSPGAFKALFPITRDILSSSESNNISGASGADLQAQQSQPQMSSNNKYITNEFELVEAIRRRMEVYVTTNSMKVIAGETLIVNLSDVLSCLSTAIEQTTVLASSPQRPPSSWVSVYVLYAAVDEPHLPSQLLAQQRLRELSLINEEEEEQLSGASKSPFDTNLATTTIEKKDQTINATTTTTTSGSGSQVLLTSANTATVSPGKAESTLRVEQSRQIAEPAVSMYNSAYDRTVALPSHPDQNSSSGSTLEIMEYFKLLSEKQSVWFGCGGGGGGGGEFVGDDMAFDLDALASAKAKARQRGKGNVGSGKLRGKGKGKRRHEDSQCSIM